MRCAQGGGVAWDFAKTEHQQAVVATHNYYSTWMMRCETLKQGVETNKLSAVMQGRHWHGTSSVGTRFSPQGSFLLGKRVSELLPPKFPLYYFLGTFAVTINKITRSGH
jgi:hypothetical protein